MASADSLPKSAGVTWADRAKALLLGMSIAVVPITLSRLAMDAIVWPHIHLVGLIIPTILTSAIGVLMFGIPLGSIAIYILTRRGVASFASFALTGAGLGFVAAALSPAILFLFYLETVVPICMLAGLAGGGTAWRFLRRT